MNVALRKPWTTDEFLAWVVNQEERYEFDGVAPVAVAGGSVIHGLIMRNRSAGNYAPMSAAHAHHVSARKRTWLLKIGVAGYGGLQTYAFEVSGTYFRAITSAGRDPITLLIAAARE